MTFSDLRGFLPLAVVFFDSAECDGCDQLLRDLQIRYRDFRDQGADVIAISVGPVSAAERTSEELGLEFPLLYDEDGSAASAWGVFSGPHGRAAVVASYVFGPTGELAASRVGTSIEEMPSVDEFLQTIRDSAGQALAEPTTTPAPGCRSGSPTT